MVMSEYSPIQVLNISFCLGKNSKQEVGGKGYIGRELIRGKAPNLY